jgi:hypothetical protein
VLTICPPPAVRHPAGTAPAVDLACPGPHGGGPALHPDGSRRAVRTIELTIPALRTDGFVADLEELELTALRLQRGASLRPPGDLVTLEVANDRLGEVMRVADRYGLGDEGGITMTTSVPLSMVGPTYQELTREVGATTWEELELSIGEDSTMRGDRTLVMFIAGVIAGIGITTGTLHAVIGAMIIAPGFQPIARFALGLINRSGAWRGGLIDVFRAYGALITGASVAALSSWLLGVDPLDAGLGTFFEPDLLVTFWSTITWAGIGTTVAAAVCGGVLISLNRTVLTAGVMVALALVPSAALVPMSLVAGDLGLAGRSLARFALEAAIVLVASMAVFAYKRRTDARRVVH